MPAHADLIAGLPYLDIAAWEQLPKLTDNLIRVWVPCMTVMRNSIMVKQLLRRNAVPIPGGLRMPTHLLGDADIDICHSPGNQALLLSGNVVLKLASTQRAQGYVAVKHALINQNQLPPEDGCNCDEDNGKAGHF